MPTALPWLLLAFPQAGSPEPPRLVVMIVVDQLIPEQLRRLGPHLQGGFARFLGEGAVFWNATVDYANTETGPGHATLATGRYPARSGIVGNSFVDREKGELLYCVGDASAHPLTALGLDAGADSVSPANLRGDALGDMLRRAQPTSLVVSIAGKDRSAVLLGGQRPDVALWWSTSAGGFSSSSYYGEKLPEFVGVWNSAWAERARGWVWESEFDGDLAALGTAADERAGEASSSGRTLPRRLPETDAGLAAAVFSTPLVDYFTLELAALALDTLELGGDGAVDFLALGLSGCDIVGHGHGPDSLEVTDLLLRDDRELGRFFARLDERVGKGRWVACLSSDHGVLDLPEALVARGVGARRVGAAEVQAMRQEVQQAVASAFPSAGELELHYVDLGFLFDEAQARSAGVDPAALRSLIAEAAQEASWVEDAYTLEELLASGPADPWLTLYRRCQAPDRGPDVALRPDPWLLFGSPLGTSHGSPYPYDRRVPLCFLGTGVKAQQRFDAASPTDAVPTLLGLLGLPLPADLDGRVLDLD